jgi:hypothetical protein
MTNKPLAEAIYELQVQNAALEAELAKQKEFRMAMMKTMEDTEKECARLRAALEEIAKLPHKQWCVWVEPTGNMAVGDFARSALTGREEGGGQHD